MTIMMMRRLLHSFSRRPSAMSLRPEFHFAPVTEQCLANNQFQCFQGNPLNRFNLHRKSVEDIVHHAAARFLPFRQLKVLIGEHDRPVWLTYRQLFEDESEPKLTLGACELVLLGIGSRLLVDRPSTPFEPATFDSNILNTFLLASEPSPDDYVFFALSIPPEQADRLPGTYSDLRLSIHKLTVVDAAVCGQGRALLDWHASSQFCGKCGSATVSLEGGTRRKCSKCSRVLYPRTDPVAITLVIHADNEHVLLGRKAVFPPHVYTCLAGFIEPGESVPEACAREVWEESGVIIDIPATRYFDSQPWPFLGGQLMIGCHARAVEHTITLHDSELEDCRWFSRDEIGEMIRRSQQTNFNSKDEGFRIPPPIAIAHQLIRTWHSTTAKSNL